MPHSIFLKPLCSRAMRHVADELIYRNINDGKGSMLSLTAQSARACSSAFFEIGLDKLVGNRQLIITVTPDVIAQLPVLGLPPDQVIIRLVDDQALTEPRNTALQALRVNGYRIIFDQLQTNHSNVMPNDFLQMSIRTEQVEADASKARQLGCRLVVTNIENAQDYEQALAMGCEWMQGPFFSDIVAIVSPLKNRKGNLAAQLSLLQEIYKPEPDINRLENLLAQDPHLVLLVLRQVNNRLRDRKTEIVSIRHASVLLGLNHLQGMITQLLLANNNPLCAFQLKRMMVRAAMCKRVAERLNMGDPREAFALGLFSLMDKYLGMEMADLVSLIPFTQRVKDALLLRTGDLGHLVKLVESFECAQIEHAQHQIVDMLNNEYLESLAWLEQIYVTAAPCKV